MLVSYNALQYALYKDKVYKENFNQEMEDKSLMKLVVFIFIIELIFLWFALFMAIKVSKNKKELLLHSMLAILFTLPYVFYNTVFDTPAYQTLKN